ncbi:MAG: hypothetical protein ACXWIT_25535 [Burkholderiales bacterium]
MGSFYTSHTARGPSQQELLDWLGTRPALVSKTEAGATVVLDAACEGQDGETLSELAAQISSHFRCVVLAVLNHDDDILYFELHENGEKTDEYNSNPAYFDDHAESDAPRGGDADRLCSVFGASDDPDKVNAVLRDTEFVFATERHDALAHALGLPLHSVGVGYSYVSEGDLPPGNPNGEYRHSKV